MTLTRRQIVVAIAALGLAPRAALAQPRRDRVLLLGTKGGPTPSPWRAAPATLLVIAGRPYLVDCGNGVGTQLAKAGIALDRLGEIFITHNHSDHVIDAGTLLVLAWGSGLVTPVTLHGPPPLGQIVRDQLAGSAYDIGVRMREEGRQPLAPLIHVDERSAGGVVLRNADVTVTSALVDHWTVRPAFAYRFDTPRRSVVLSGDTTYSDNLVQLAKGADLLIHEALYAPAIDRMGGENAPNLREHLLKSHSTTEQVGLVATRAGVKKLVLSHLVPAAPSITDAMWLEGVRKYYHGPAVVGRDLMEV